MNLPDLLPSKQTPQQLFSQPFLELLPVPRVEEAAGFYQLISQPVLPNTGKTSTFDLHASIKGRRALESYHNSVKLSRAQYGAQPEKWLGRKLRPAHA